MLSLDAILSAMLLKPLPLRSAFANLFFLSLLILEKLMFLSMKQIISRTSLLKTWNSGEGRWLSKVTLAILARTVTEREDTS
ncbi:hypothetical protein Syun_005977 [Stephania yunnanensis]|uniref:Uncharacterized protein n=1 Tax=Stephania yunnanensis TaxID=152371 RepID=A0AAP0KVS9_9MAGN